MQRDGKRLPIFIPEWTVWDTVITHHYEEDSGPAKDFMYELLQKNTYYSPSKIGIIPVELADALFSAFGDRNIFHFLLENCASTEEIPPIMTRGFDSKIPHRVAAVVLGFWKSINYPDVYVVTEDKAMRDGITTGMKDMGLNLTHLNIVSPAEALHVVLEKC